jgi:hypothetical protein
MPVMTDEPNQRWMELIPSRHHERSINRLLPSSEAISGADSRGPLPSVLGVAP